MRLTLLSAFVFFIYTCAKAQSNFTQLNPVIDELAKNLKQTNGKQKIGLAYITDSNKNLTELSEGLSNYIIVRLVVNGLQLVDRSLYDWNTLEKTKAGKAEISIDSTIAKAKDAGIEVYIKGEYALTGNAKIILTLKAIHVRDNTIASAAMGELELNEQMVSLLKNNSGTAAQSINVMSTPRVGDSQTNPLDDLFRAKISDMRPEDCKCVPMYNEVCGGICFENQTGEDIVMYEGYFLEATGSGRDWYKRLLPVVNGGRNCIDKILVNHNQPDQVSTGIVFKFRTLNEERPKFGEIKLSVDKRKVKAYVLTKANLIMLPRR